MIGSPPSSGTTGMASAAKRPLLTMSSNTLLGLPVSTQVRAFSGATAALISGAPSIRCSHKA